VENYYDHDSLFKALIREFFADFIQLFFADWAARFDFSTVQWLDKEIHSDPPDGRRHLLDLVAKLGTTAAPVDGPDEWIALVHIEIESPDRTTALKPRLPAYYMHLVETYGRPVLPIVLYLKVGLDGIGVDTVTHRVFDFEPLTYRYLYVGLPALDAERYLRGESWLGVALSALMRIPKDKIVEWGIDALEKIGSAPITEQQRYLLGECIETYSGLADEHSADFRRELERRATGRVTAMNKTRIMLAHERGKVEGREEGREEGIEKGREEGLRSGLRAAVFELLEAKRIVLPVDSIAMIENEVESDRLRRWLLAAGQSTTLDEFLARSTG